MHLRAYRPDDLRAVHQVNEAAHPAVASETFEDLGHIADQSAIALVATTDAGAIAGFCLVLEPGANYDADEYLWFSERYDDFLYLDRVAVGAHYKRRGVGRALYTEVDRLIAEHRPTATHLTLEVNIEPRNDESLAFHTSLGFVEVGQKDTDYGTRVSLMTKPLR
jgi:predicted GNAT superfamily acetyltransferase